MLTFLLYVYNEYRMEKSAEQPFKVRTEKLVFSPAEITWRSDNFPNLPMSETILSWCLPDGEIENIENVRKAITLNEMGREVGWGFMIFENKSGERFAFLGIKGVGITGVGREFMKTVARPAASAVEAISRREEEEETMAEIYDLKKRKRLLLPKEGEEGLPVAGLVGLKEAETDRDNARKLIREGFWTAEPVMIFKQEDSEVVKEAKERGIIPADEQEAREVRAFRNPLRLNKLHELNSQSALERGTEEDLEKIKSYLKLSSRIVRFLGEDLKEFGQKDEIANFTLWYFRRLGKQSGIMAQAGFWHKNIIELQNTTLAGEIVDLGTETAWREPGRDSAMMKYRQGLNMASVIYASASLLGKEIDLEGAVRHYHAAFMEECKKREGFGEKIVQRVSSCLYEKEIWLEPVVNSRGDLVRINLLGGGRFYLDRLFCLGSLPEEMRKVDWGEKMIRLPKHGYMDLLRFYAGKCWQKEVNRLTEKETIQKRAA